MSFEVDGKQIYNSFMHASEILQREKDKLNTLNLFPVADRDTGVNMALTIKKTADHLPDIGTPAEILEAAYLNLLEFSHGNSGTILTLFFGGFRKAIPDKNIISGRDLAEAIKNGADTAFSGIANPMPGTILSVASRSAEAGMSMLEITEDTGQIMKRICDEAHAALMQTPFQNQVLMPYQVVDSGALGFCLVMDGFLSGIAPELHVTPYPALRFPDESDSEESGSGAAELPYRYCTEFVININAGVDPEILRQEVEPLGDYFVLATSDSLCKVHIHTNIPEKILSIASKYGTVKSSKVDDMLQQL